ncbi:uncharacterized protein [Ptychodera flava]|uniref:uncharacterized protein n=1 Tax=Ptychodera flava TaxID=63121 RepID=UPI00396A8DCE
MKPTVTMENILRTILTVLFGLIALDAASAASLLDTGKSSVNICKNGGIMVLGSFCICPSYFAGQYCEEEQKPCGEVLHDETVEMNCNLCLCRNGRLYCVPHGRPDCYEKRKEVVKVITMPPLPTTTESDDSESEYDSFYFDEWFESSAVSLPTTTTIILRLSCLLLCLILCR